MNYQHKLRLRTAAGIAVLAFLTFLAGPGAAQSSAKSAVERTLTIQVNNILPERNGQLLIFLFRDDGFPTKHARALKTIKVPVSGASMRIPLRIKGKSTDAFAIKVLHDEDKNGRVTKKFGGIIPREGLGFSSGARLSWNGPPKFKQARFDLASVAQAMTITLIYP